VGVSKFHLPNPQTPKLLPTMTSPQNMNAGTVVPIIVNPEVVLVDSDLEDDLEEIQHEAAAEQKRIEEAVQAKLAAAHECIEKKWQERKAKEEEAQKVEEVQKAEVEEEWKWKEEEDKAIQDKARKRELEVSSFNLFDICQKLIDSRCCGKRRRRGRLGGWILMG